MKEVLGGHLAARIYLEPFIAAEVIGDPSLSALIFASDPVPEQLSRVGIALPLEHLVVHKSAAVGVSGGRIGFHAFDAHIEPGHSGDLGEIEARAPGGAPWSVDGGDVVVHFSIRVESEVFAHERQPVGKVKCAETRTGVVATEFYGCGG